MSMESEGQTAIDQRRLRRIASAGDKPVIIADGVDALKRLVMPDGPNSNRGPCRIAARFVLGLYSGSRFLINLNELRYLEESVFVDCMAVLRMDARIMEKEVHEYFENGGDLLESIAEKWGFEED